MINAEDFVLDNADLRKEILKYIVKDKYYTYLHSEIKAMLEKEIIQNWYKFCSCELCVNEQHVRLNGGNE